MDPADIYECQRETPQYGELYYNPKQEESYCSQRKNQFSLNKSQLEKKFSESKSRKR